MTTRRLLLIAILGALAVRVGWSVETESPTGGPVVELTIPPGSSTQAIAEKLVSEGVIPRTWTFQILIRTRGDGARLKAGRYRFAGPYSMLDVEQKITEGDVERRDVTFPEGRNMFEMADLVNKVGLSSADFLSAAKDQATLADLDGEATSLEGYLFPETYDIKEGYTSAALVGEMVKHARGVFDSLGLTPSGRAIEGQTLTLRQIVTLASIVELETAAPAERPHIAGVFLNRLRAGMRLQTDPTVIYAMKLQGQYHGNIRKADLASDSPYNTYQVAGLPPGPIGSPGRTALEAVLNPDMTDDLYFVSRNDGTHVFSKTLTEHERAVDTYQRHRSAESMPTSSASEAATTKPSPAPSSRPHAHKRK
ncbi:MAG: endolytic transglycosylase MltG [Vicinamibacteria bacterium]